MNYYEILNVSKTSSFEEIKKSYRKLAMIYHPDRNNGDKQKEVIFQEINLAYSILSDEHKKKSYDDSISNYKSSINNITNYVKDIFVPKVNNIKVKLTFWEAVMGCEKEFSVKYKRADGAYYNQPIKVFIPSGVFNGELIAMKGEFGKTFMLELIVPYQSDDKLYTRKVLDIHTVLDIPFTISLLGGKVNFPHFDGYNLAINITPTDISGKEYTYNGKGVKGEPQFGNLIIKLNIVKPKFDKEDVIAISKLHSKYADSLSNIKNLKVITK